MRAMAKMQMITTEKPTSKCDKIRESLSSRRRFSGNVRTQTAYARITNALRANCYYIVTSMKCKSGTKLLTGNIVDLSGIAGLVPPIVVERDGEFRCCDLACFQEISLDEKPEVRLMCRTERQPAVQSALNAPKERS
jgi:hypothetical protein